MLLKGQKEEGFYKHFINIPRINFASSSAEANLREYFRGIIDELKLNQYNDSNQENQFPANNLKLNTNQVSAPSSTEALDIEKFFDDVYKQSQGSIYREKDNDADSWIYHFKPELSTWKIGQIKLNKRTLTAYPTGKFINEVTGRPSITSRQRLAKVWSALGLKVVVDG